MDTLSQSQRHFNMSRVRSANTSPERLIRSALFRAGLRYRICDKRFPGKPDIVFEKYFAVVFINGCFWHAHENCARFRIPKTNVFFWKQKFLRNKIRDKKIIERYKDECWRICVVWECAIKGKNSKAKIESVKDKIIAWLEDPSEPFLEIRG